MSIQLITGSQPVIGCVKLHLPNGLEVSISFRSNGNAEEIRVYRGNDDITENVDSSVGEYSGINPTIPELFKTVIAASLHKAE